MSKHRARRRTIGDAKAHFAECIREAEAGRSIVLTRHGRAVASLEPIREPPLREAEGHQPAEVAEPVTPHTATSPSSFQSPAARRAALRRRLVEEIWPRIPKELLGRGVTKPEREEILGYSRSTGVGPEADSA